MKKNESILLLEKNQLLKILYRDEFSDERYTTIFADDDRDALLKIKKFFPDLFITTYQMPSTESFVDMLRQTREKKNIPILINSAYPQEIMDGASCEMAEYITNTSDVKMLKNKINALLHSYNA